MNKIYYFRAKIIKTRPSMIPPSELIINPDNTIYHLNIRPNEIAQNIILVGDPGRVDTVATMFHSVKYTSQNREFRSVTGTYNNKDITVLSTGIGTGNIDIVLTELDALFNIDFSTREERPQKTQLNIVRIGTSGSLQEDVPVGSVVITNTAIGLDGVLNYYAGRNDVCNLKAEAEFCKAVDWNPLWPAPYIVGADQTLLDTLKTLRVTPVTCNAISEPYIGTTVTAPGFFGPQGRIVRLNISNPDINQKLKDYGVTNYEMESSALYGLAKLLGHHAVTLCLIVAGRATKEFDHPDEKMKQLIEHVLNNLL